MNRDKLIDLLNNPPEFKVDKDFEYLNEKLSKAIKTNEEKKVQEAITAERALMTQRRKSKMGDARFKFVINKRDSILHDRTCKLVRKIPDEHFDMKENLGYQTKMCKACHIRALIRNCIDDQNDIEAVEDFFKRIYAKREDIIELLNRREVELKIISLNVLEIKVKCDKWRIYIYSKNGQLALKHNNYHIEDRKRIMDEGFHNQTINGRRSFKAVCQIMINYKSKFHIEEEDAYLEMAPDNNVAIDNNDFNIKTAVRLKRFSLIFNRYIFIDTKSRRHEKVFKKRKIRYRIVKELFSQTTPYGVIVCDIPKWHQKKIFAAINNIKADIYKEGHGRICLCGIGLLDYLNREKIEFRSV